ncbi:hypothetical protein ACQ4PT_047294 [Festuca glaucescens]
MQQFVEKQLTLLNNRVRFLSSVINGDIQIINMKRKDLLHEFTERGFDPLPKDGRPVPIGATGGRGDEENEENPDVVIIDYDYLTSMSVSSLTEEYLDHLLVLKKKFEALKNTFEINFDHKKALLRGDAKGCKISEAPPKRWHIWSADECLKKASDMLMVEEAPVSEGRMAAGTSQEYCETANSETYQNKKHRTEFGKTGARPTLREIKKRCLALCHRARAPKKWTT